MVVVHVQDVALDGFVVWGQLLRLFFVPWELVVARAGAAAAAVD